METKFQTKPVEELRKFSTEELKVYIASMQAEANRLEVETTALRLKAKMDRDRTLELKGELKVWKEINEDLKKKKGMAEVTDIELEWLMDGNYEKYWGEGKCYFKPDQWAMKAKYAEVMGTTVDDSKFDGVQEMKIPSAWVDRQGTYFPVGLAEHDQWAWTYVLDKYGRTEGGKKIASMAGGSASEFLESSGWVRVMNWPGSRVKFFLPEKLTHAQKKTIDKYCYLHKEPLPFKDPLF